MTSHPGIYLLRRENFMDLLSNTTNTAKEKVTKVTGSKEDKRNKAKAKTQEKFKLNARTIAQIGMLSALATILMLFEIPRSEERRVGKECRSRRSPYHSTNKKSATIHQAH